MMLLILVPLLESIPAANSLVEPNGVGRVPALGWNSWNAYACSINEQSFIDAAQLMVSTGLKVCSTQPGSVGRKYLSATEIMKSPLPLSTLHLLLKISNT